MAARNQVYRITGAQVALSEDQAARTRRYLISMAIRTVCFLGAVFTDGWLRWVLVVGAVVLPYVAVVVANAGKERTKDTMKPIIVHDDTRVLMSGSPNIIDPSHTTHAASDSSADSTGHTR